MLRTSARGKWKLAMPVVSHVALRGTYKGWAESCGYKPRALWRATRRAVLTRHAEAVIWNSERVGEPPVFQLSLGRASVFYTIESHGIVIRGYGWEIDGEPLDDFDGGGYFVEHDWEVGGGTTDE